MYTAQERIDQFDRSTDTYKYLHAMYNGPTDDGGWFSATKAEVEKQIMKCEDLKDLETLALDYKYGFVAPLIGDGSRCFVSSDGGSSDKQQSVAESTDIRRASSAEITPTQRMNTPPKKLIFRNKSVRKLVLERDNDRCVLTGQSDIKKNGKRRGHEVAHIIPHSVLNRDTVVKSLIRSMAPWLPNEFYSKVDTCENAIVLNKYAHESFGKLNWFIVMDDPDDAANTTYRAMQVVENGELEEQNLGRNPQTDDDGNTTCTSTYNQALYIGTGSHPRPAKEYIKLFELLARVVHMCGGAEAIIDLFDDEEEVDPIRAEEGTSAEEKVQMWRTQTSIETLYPVEELPVDD